MTLEAPLSNPDKTPIAQRISRWLDWWFTPRWRALVTWIVLTGIWAGVDSTVNYGRIIDVLGWPFHQLNHLLVGRLPDYCFWMAVDVTYLFIYSWFQPLALRLNLSRGAVWLSLQLTPGLWGELATPPMAIALHLTRSAGLWVVLRGWRSRPWLACLGSLAINPGFIWVRRIMGGDAGNQNGVWHWIWPVFESLLFAVALLFGTRLLTPEERAQVQGESFPE